eukprot:m.1657100 g.1657100  ORF g.1657100 m.1657100 type:complete len:53 (-) comp110544_c0_seq1:85-243(-)
MVEKQNMENAPEHFNIDHEGIMVHAGHLCQLFYTNTVCTSSLMFDIKQAADG